MMKNFVMSTRITSHHFLLRKINYLILSQFLHNEVSKMKQKFAANDTYLCIYQRYTVSKESLPDVPCTE